jgi:ABC-type bacteriocin/lantibiotic exporter with double-glycine peptidase domain
MRTSFPHYTQLDSMDCGPTCLRMIAKHYGRSYTLQNLRERSFITRETEELEACLQEAYAVHYFFNTWLTDNK